MSMLQQVRAFCRKQSGWLLILVLFIINTIGIFGEPRRPPPPERTLKINDSISVTAIGYLGYHRYDEPQGKGSCEFIASDWITDRGTIFVTLSPVFVIHNHGSQKQNVFVLPSTTGSTYPVDKIVLQPGKTHTCSFIFPDSADWWSCKFSSN